MKTLKNTALTLNISLHGAELTSIRDSFGREFLWQADPAFWKRHSPVLFPIVGSLWDKHFRVNGREYEMGQHGFARDMDFSLVSEREDEMWFELTSSPETLAKYPYEFTLRIGYRLEANKIHVMWEVSGDDSQTMWFQIGAHPAFYLPRFVYGGGSCVSGTGSCASGLDSAIGPTSGSAVSIAVSDFDRECLGCFRLYGRGAGGVVPLESFRYIKVSEKQCTDISDVQELATPGGVMPLDDHTFDIGAYIIGDSQVCRVDLVSTTGLRCVSLEFDTPLVGLWAPSTEGAPFVCIEPWYGRCDRVGFTGEFSERDCVNSLSPGQVFRAGYTITVG